MKKLKSRNQKPDFRNQTSEFRKDKPEEKVRRFEQRSSDAKFENREPKIQRFRRENSDSQVLAVNSNVVFGLSPVLEALRANSRRIEKILIAEGAREHRISEIIDLAKENNILWQKMPRENLTRMIELGANHQGVVAVTSAADYTDAEKLLTGISAKENALTVILDGVEDPRNLGAILRSVECAGADGVFIPERRAVGLTETVAKSSAGATEHVKVAKVANLNRLIEELKKNDFWVVGTSGDAVTDYSDWDWTRKTALVLGGEGKGLHRLTAEKCDVLVKIPMYGKIESLNVSVAAGVILFEAVRQKNKK